MIAVKGNRYDRIAEDEREQRRAEGFDIYDDRGELIAWSKLKTVPWDEYAALKAKYERLKARRGKEA